MAFFKFRKGGDEHAAPAPAPESVEAMRTRARHRLIGASVLVVVGEFDAAQFDAWVDRYFGPLRTPPSPIPRVTALRLRDRPASG